MRRGDTAGESGGSRMMDGGWRTTDAWGRGYRSGQGLRRGILLGLRESAKSIAAGPELACGSDSRPCRNNADSRSPSSYHPSSAAAQTDILSPRLVHPAGRKNIKCAESMVVRCRTGKLLFTGNIPRGVFCERRSQKTRAILREFM